MIISTPILFVTLCLTLCLNLAQNLTLTPNPYSFAFVSDPGQHVCEVQLVHEGMLTARKHCNAHASYSKFRSALELLETFGLMQTPNYTDDAGPGFDTSSAQGLASEELAKHRVFIQELDSEYDAFLDRYQQMLGIPPVIDTDDTLSLEDYRSRSVDDCASHDSVTGAATDLEVEVRQLRKQNGSQQKQINDQQQQITVQQTDIISQQKQIIDQQRQIEQILLRLKELEH